MNLIDVSLLSIVEGITEFLPISSTGHMILTSHLLDVPQNDFLKTFEVVIQIGPILAIALLYYKRLISQKELFLKACIGFIPTGILGIILYPKIKPLLGSELVTVAALFLGGIAILIIEWQISKRQGRQNHSDIQNAKIVQKNMDTLRYKQSLYLKPHHINLDSLRYRDALGVGLIQSISMIPGVSRSASSIFGGMALGLDRKSAVEFSFILAIPTMLAATSLDLLEGASLLTTDNLFYIIFGTTLSFLVALAVVKWFLRFIKTSNFVLFGIYRIVFSIIYALLFIF